MPDFSIISATTSRGAEDAELEVVVADFDDASEAKGYARRDAEEMHALSGQLDLDFDYSHVSVYAGEVDPSATEAAETALIGMWLLVEDGVEWASAEALRAPAADA